MTGGAGSSAGGGGAEGGSGGGGGAGGGWAGPVTPPLPDLERRGIVAAATSADSAPIGDSRALYRDGILSYVNGPASARGARVGMKLGDFIASLIATARR